MDLAGRERGGERLGVHPGDIRTRPSAASWTTAGTRPSGAPARTARVVRRPSRDEPDREPGRGHRGLDLGDGVDPAMEDRGGEDRVGAAVADRRDEVRGAGRAAGRDDRHVDTRDVIARSRSVSKPDRSRRDRSRSRAARRRRGRPRGRPSRRRRARSPRGRPGRRPPRPAPRPRRSPPGVDRDDDRLAPERAGAARDERRVRDRRRVERDLVGAGAEDVAHLVDASHAAADGQRDERPPGRPLDDVEERAAALRRGGDVEEDELVGALARRSARRARAGRPRRRGRRTGCP